MSKEPKPKKSGQTPEARAKALEAEIERVRTREEKRLIKVARKAGLFDLRLTNSQLHKMIRTGIAELKPGPSPLAKLGARKLRAARTGRKNDARRKALLGGFLVAQCRHKPGLHKNVVPNLRTYLEDHANTKVAARNLALLEGFMGDPFHGSVSGGRKGSKGQENAPSSDHRERAHRLILLGTWLLARRATNPKIAALITDELDGFLKEDGNVARNRKLLDDLLSNEG